MRRGARAGSALVMALWIILVLSIMVLSFATEAHMQAGVNVYVREKKLEWDRYSREVTDWELKEYLRRI